MGGFYSPLFVSKPRKSHLVNALSEKWVMVRTLWFARAHFLPDASRKRSKRTVRTVLTMAMC
jgi:hypothetical protein